MGTNKDAIQRAVVSLIAVVGALGNGTLDTLICFAIHFGFLLLKSLYTNPVFKIVPGEIPIKQSLSSSFAGKNN